MKDKYKSHARKSLSVIAALGIVLSMVGGVGGIGLIGTATADLGVDGCVDDAAAVSSTVILSPIIGILGSGSTVGYSNLQDPCWSTDPVNNDLGTQETYNSALNYAELKAGFDHQQNELVDSEIASKEPVRSDARQNSYKYYVTADSPTKSGFVNEARDTVNERYDERQVSAVSKFNAHMRTANGTLQQLSNDNAVGLMSVYVNGSEVDTSGGINFNIPDDQSDTSAGITVTLPSGEEVQAATVTVTNSSGTSTTYTYTDNLVVTVDDPSGSGSPAAIVGTDRGLNWGAGSYDGDVTASNADIVVDAAGGADYTTIQDAINNAPAGSTVFVESGDYTLASQTTVSNNIEIVGDSNVSWVLDGYSPAFVINADFTLRNIAIDSNTGDIARVDTSGVTITYDHVDMVGNGNTEIDSVNSVSHTGDLSESYVSDMVINGNFSAETEGQDYIVTLYKNWAKGYISDSETDRNAILNNFGTASDNGYLSTVYDSLQNDTIDATDYLTTLDVVRNSFGESDIKEQVYQDLRLSRMGLAVAGDTKTSIEVTAQSGATVRNSDTSSGSTLSSKKTYKGHLWTLNPPSDSTWQSGETYDTSNLGGPIYLTYYDTEETMTDGTLTVETVAKTVKIEGKFTVGTIKDANGETVSFVTHGSPTDPADPYDPNTYTQQQEEAQETAKELAETAETNDGGAGGSGGDACGISLFGYCSGITSFQISILGGFIGLVVLGYLGRPLLVALANITE